MIWGFEDSTLLTAAYALLLVGLGALLEWLGRGSHRFAERFHLAGFRFDPERDVWHCPEGQRLFNIASDPLARTVVYQAPAHACNACHARPNCTDSSDGRRIERRVDSWFESELWRFHQGITLVLLALAAVVLVWRMEGPDGLRDRLLLGGLFAPLPFMGIRLIASLMRRPGSDERVAPRME